MILLQRAYRFLFLKKKKVNYSHNTECNSLSAHIETP